MTRRSNGLEQFCAFLQGSSGLSILDMSGASQANIGFVTDLGHRISSDDVVGTMQHCFGDDFFEAQKAPSKAQRFLDQTLTFPDHSFDGALVWDTLQFFNGDLLNHIVGELFRVMRPGGLMLAFFNADEKTTRIPIYNYRIHDAKTLLLAPRAEIAFQQVQYFNNRMLEKMFTKAASVKFFLTRDHLRELIIRR